MSYPYELDLSVGSEAGSAGGSIGLGIVSIVDDDGRVKPVKGEVYVSNKVDVYRKVGESGDASLESVEFYYVFDITNADIDTEEQKDAIRSVLNGLSVTVEEGSTAVYKVTDPVDGKLSNGWELKMNESNRLFSLEATFQNPDDPDNPTIYTIVPAGYIVGGNSPVDTELIYYRQLNEQYQESTPSDRTFTFKD